MATEGDKEPSGPEKGKKFKIYWCRCGRPTVRSLNEKPGECDLCGADLTKEPFVVEDDEVFTRRLMRKRRPSN